MTELERMELRFEWYGEEGEALAYKIARNIGLGDTVSLEPLMPVLELAKDGTMTRKYPLDHVVTVKGLRVIVTPQPEYEPSPPFKLSDKVIQLAREHYNKVAPYIARNFSRMEG